MRIGWIPVGLEKLAYWCSGELGEDCFYGHIPPCVAAGFGFRATLDTLKVTRYYSV